MLLCAWMRVNMTDMQTPDLCAHLDRMRTLCDQLEGAQRDAARSRELVERIRLEVEELAKTVGTLEGKTG